jgi:phenylacetate-CoA ligase
MISKSFWNEKIETASPAKLKELQLNLLKQQIQRAYTHSKFYKRKFDEAGFYPAQIRNLEDVRKIPFTTREELEKNFEEVLPIPFSQVATIHQTSGTSGTPLTVAFTKKDIDDVAEAYARKLTHHSVTSKDIVQVTGAYGLWQGAWSIHWGAEKIGACVIPAGPGDTEKQIKMIKRFGTTVLYGVTNYHFRILEVAKQISEDLRNTSLRVAICVAEKPTKHQIDILKADAGYEDVMIDYGATEFPGFSVHCRHDPSVHHVWADYYLTEAVDQDSLEPLEEGKRGELVITSLQREAFPIIRYLTGDVTDLIGFEECGCGLTHPKIGINIDRVDFMVKVRGSLIFPSGIELILDNHPELSGQYQIVVDKRTPRQEITLKVEPSTKLSRMQEDLLRQKIIKEMKAGLGVTVNSLVFALSGTFEGKARKTVVIT